MQNKLLVRQVPKQIVEEVKTISLVLTMQEAEDIRKSVGDTSYYERQQLFKSPHQYRSNLIGQEDIFGLMYEQIGEALSKQPTKA